MKNNYLFILLSILTLSNIHAEKIDYNTYYSFPLAMTVEYEGLSLLSDYSAAYSVNGVNASFHIPIPGLPSFQPFARGGMINFDSLDLDEPIKWDHYHLYGGLGLSYLHRFEKKFEVGADIHAAYSHAFFPNLFEEAVGHGNLMLDAGAKVHLDPSYNLSIAFNPGVKYMRSLGVYTTLDGLMLKLGFQISYRFGEDPDSAASLIKSLNIKLPEEKNLFSSMHGYYSENPFGKVTVTNRDRVTIKNLKTHFFQAGYMDSPTLSSVIIPELGPGESAEIPLLALFNSKVFSIEGVTPVTGEIIYEYERRGKPIEQRTAFAYKLYDKTAVTWDDNRKIAALITPSDSALRNYAGFLRNTAKTGLQQGYSNPVQFAVTAFHGLGEIGCLYQPDPVMPFTEVQENPFAVDTVSLPRDTLKRITGDCDDLTVLYNSLLEAAGVETGFITTPGHVFSAVNTHVSPKDYQQLHPDRNMGIVIEDSVWIPVEITTIGRGTFSEAWEIGVAEFNHTPEGERRFYKTRESQKLYKPVALVEIDLGLQYGSGQRVASESAAEIKDLVNLVISSGRQDASKDKTKHSWNRLGIMYAKFGRLSEAESAFKQALGIDADYLSASVNLGNVHYLKKDYSSALTAFEKAYKTLASRDLSNGRAAGVILINISKTQYHMAQYDKAKEAYSVALESYPEISSEYAYLAQAAETGTARAADAEFSASDIFYADFD